MSDKEPYDYIDVAVPDNDVTLSVTMQGTITENSTKNQVPHVGDDGSVEVVTLADASIFYISVPWKKLTSSDAGTIMDFWHSSAKGHGRAKTFKLVHSDGHTYVVRFWSDLSRSLYAAKGRHGVPDIVFKIEGRIAD